MMGPSGKFAVATLVTVLCVAAMAGGARAMQENAEGPVPTFRNLTRATLDDVRQGDWLLAVVAPWCGYSQSLVNKLPILVHNLYLRKKQVQVAVIDGEEDPSVYTQFSLKAYPFICYVHNGEIHPYNGTQESMDLLEWTLRGWRDVEPLRGPTNPFGWQMTLFGAVAHVAWVAYDFVTTRAAPLSLSPSAAFSALFGLCTLVALVVLSCCVARCSSDIVVPFPENKPSKKAAPAKYKPLSQSQSLPKAQEQKAKKQDKKKDDATLRQRKTAAKSKNKGN